MRGLSATSLSSAYGVFSRGVRSAVILLFVFLIRCYQGTIRPLLIGSCKFHPTCSEYAIEAIQIHGPLGGMGLAVRRLLRCHPFSPGGIDPVPEQVSSKATSPRH